MPHPQPTPELQRIERDYRRDVTITETRPRIVQAALFLWALVDVALIIIFIVSVVLYVISGSFADERAFASVGQNAGVSHARAVDRTPDALFTDDARVLARGDGAYDMYAVVENPNGEWYATYTYSFESSTGTTTPIEGVIMPNETRYLVALNLATSARPSGAVLAIDELAWHRIDRHDVADIDAFLAERSNFVVDASAYAVDVTLADESIGRSTFTVRNATPYAYFRPTFTVLLKKGGTVVGINQVTISEFLAGETRETAVHWFGAVPSGGTVELVPTIDYFDDAVYMDPSGSTDIDLRDIDFDN